MAEKFKTHQTDFVIAVIGLSNEYYDSLKEQLFNTYSVLVRSMMLFI